MILPVCVLHLPSHHSEELREVNGAVAIRVHLIDHILELKLRGILTQRPKKKIDRLEALTSFYIAEQDTS